MTAQLSISPDAHYFHRLRRHRFFQGMAAAFVSICGMAHAAGDPVSGKQLYFSTPGGINCSNSSCHGSNVAQNKNKVLAGANNPTAIQNAIDAGTGGMGIYIGVLSSTQVADIAAYIGNPNVTSGPVASVTPSTLSFTSTTLGSTASSKTITVKSAGDQTLVLSGISSSSTEFPVTGGTCTATTSLSVNSSCTILVGFTPSATGARSGTLTISSNAASSSTVTLSGTGSEAASSTTISVNPASLNFNSIAISESSAEKSVTLTNSGSGTLNLQSLEVSGAQASEFIFSGTCEAGVSLAASRSCTLGVSFAPAATGSRTATLTIISNASNGSQQLALSGTGVSTGTASPAAAPGTLGFGTLAVGSSSAVQTVTVSNTGSATLTLGTISLGSSDFTISGGSCSDGLAIAPGGGSCSVELQFTPGSSGALSDTLSISHDASGSPLTASLSGTGQAAGSLARISPSSITLQTARNSTRSAIATLSNAGTTELTLTAIALGGTNADAYTLGTGTTCVAPGVLAANDSCIIEIVFQPKANGTLKATLEVTHDDDANNPSSISLTGIATLLPLGEISASNTLVDFGTEVVGVSSDTQAVTITNTGSAKLSLQSIAVGGSHAADFAIDTDTSTCDTATILTGGQSCVLNFRFTPAALGARSGSVLIASKANGFNLANLILTLSGSGVDNTARVTLDNTFVNFGGAVVGVAATTRTATLSNSGASDLTLQSISVSPAVFAVSSDCPTTLSAGDSCTLNLDFTPTSVGSYAGVVTIESSAASSPDRIDVSGIGNSNGGILQWNGASALSFDSTAVGSSSATATLTLTNTGTAAAKLIAFALGGDAPADFAPQSGDSTACTVGGSLAVGDTCTLSYRFVPSTAGTRSATLDVQSDGTAPPTATLSGTGTQSSTASSTALANAGYGGCSLGTPGQPADPVWGLMLVLAAYAVWRRRRGQSLARPR